jgi:hypothetical protein
MHHFDAHDRATMVAVRSQIREAIQPLAAEIAHDIPSFEGFALFQQDLYHPDSAGTILQANAPAASSTRLQFQHDHIAGRRVDLDVSTLGSTFTTGRYELADSAMNTEHAVAGIHIPEQLGVRAASVFQLAFTKGLGLPTTEQLATIKQQWARVEPACLPHLATLRHYASRYPNQSVSDALLLDVPTTPNAFVVAWDMSGSRQAARTQYPRLRDHLTVYGELYHQFVAAHGGQLLGSTGDGQAFAFEIPSPQYDRLSGPSVARFARNSVVPALKQVLSAAPSSPAVRFAVGLGRIEHTTFDMSSPVLWELADVLDQLPRSELAVGYTPRVLQCLGLTATELDQLTTKSPHPHIVIT